MGCICVAPARRECNERNAPAPPRAGAGTRDRHAACKSLPTRRSARTEGLRTGDRLVAPAREHGDPDGSQDQAAEGQEAGRNGQAQGVARLPADGQGQVVGSPPRAGGQRLALESHAWGHRWPPRRAARSQHPAHDPRRACQGGKGGQCCPVVASMPAPGFWRTSVARPTREQRSSQRLRLQPPPEGHALREVSSRGASGSGSDGQRRGRGPRTATRD